MVCIAAFIVLAICVLSLPIVRIFSKKTADSIWKMFKKAVYCFTHRVTFRKCDSTFKDDVKNSVLRRVVIKHSTWVKPLGMVIEILSVVLIIITIWSLLVGVKSLVSLYVYGTCDVARPAACALDATEACSIDGESGDFWQDPVGWTGNWFVEFGEAIIAIPARMQTWDAQKYIPDDAQYYNAEDTAKPYALDIFDPGCIICKRSYRAQLESGFFEKYNVALLPYPIRSDDGYKFRNSYIIASYIEATRINPLRAAERPAEWQIVDRLFMDNDPNLQIDYQTAFNEYYSADEARSVIERWLVDFGYSSGQINVIGNLAESMQVADVIAKNQALVDSQIKTKKIPTMIYDGGRHEGLFDQ